MGWGLNKRIPPDKAMSRNKAEVSELRVAEREMKQREESNDEGMEESEDEEDESEETTRLLFGGNGIKICQSCHRNAPSQEVGSEETTTGSPFRAKGNASETGGATD